VNSGTVGRGCALPAPSVKFTITYFARENCTVRYMCLGEFDFRLLSTLGYEC